MGSHLPLAARCTRKLDINNNNAMNCKNWLLLFAALFVVLGCVESSVPLQPYCYLKGKGYTHGQLAEYNGEACRCDQRNGGWYKPEEFVRRRGHWSKPKMGGNKCSF